MGKGARQLAQAEPLGRLKPRLKCAYPTLRVQDNHGAVCVRGTFPVRDGRRLLHRYAVEIVLAEGHPYELPKIRETRGEIPRSVDRHVNPDGTLCVVLPAEYWLTHTSVDLIAYLDGEVRSFFVSQLYFDRFGSWPFGERSHGLAGLFEFCDEIFQTQDIDQVERYLDYLERPALKGHWRCPCGSGQRLRRCHGARLRELKQKLPGGFVQRFRRSLALGGEQ